MQKLAIIGCGYWGQKLIRVFDELNHCKILYAIDQNKKNLNKIKKKYPHIVTHKNYHSIIKQKNIDAVVIATPPVTHYKITKNCLLHNKHVLVEKPLVLESKKALKLKKIAQQKELKLLVDHTFLYSSEIQTIKKLIDQNTIGNLVHINSLRLSLGKFRFDTNVVWDLAVHDLSILNYLHKDKIISVQANGMKTHLRDQYEHEFISNIKLTYENKLTANILCSWLNPIKTRQFFIIGTKKIIILDHLQNTNEMLTICDYTINKSDLSQPIITAKNCINIKKIEPLKAMANNFIDCIQTGIKPISNIDLAIDTIKQLELIDHKIKQVN